MFDSPLLAYACPDLGREPYLLATRRMTVRERGDGAETRDRNLLRQTLISS